MPEAVLLTANTIEHLAVLDYRIERLEALIAAGRRAGGRTVDLEQALAMCIRNRTLMYETELGAVTLAAADRGTAFAPAVAATDAREA